MWYSDTAQGPEIAFGSRTKPADTAAATDTFTDTDVDTNVDMWLHFRSLLKMLLLLFAL